jgi:hypothetical protein
VIPREAKPVGRVPVLGGNVIELGRTDLDNAHEQTDVDAHMVRCYW